MSTNSNLASLVATSAALSETRSRKKKTALIAAWLRSLAAPERRVGASYVAGVVPAGRIGVGRAAISVAQKQAPAIESSLSLLEVESTFEAIAGESGAGSNGRRAHHLGGLFARATAPEQSFLTGLLSGSIRQGANEGILVEAIAVAAEIPPELVRHASMVAGDVPAVAVAALEGGAAALGEFRITLFRPLSPMLAQPVETVAEIYDTLPIGEGGGGDFALELKMDGARVQAHKRGDEVKLYSRNLRELTSTLPGVVEAVRALPVESVILDGEAIALQGDGRPERFQTTMSRFSSHAPPPEARLSSFFFDCIYLEGDDLLSRPSRERFEALEAATPAEHRMERIVPTSADEAAAFAKAALDRGHEGVMAKSLASSYRAGRRGADWLKLKPVYTLDLVVLAAEWGSGRRRGTLSNLHLGARDGAGGFVMLGKTFKGLTDKLLAWQTQAFLERETGRDKHTVYVRPELVVEIAFGGVLASPTYPGGLALRFARVRRYRDDKSADDADTIEAVRAIFER